MWGLTAADKRFQLSQLSPQRAHYDSIKEYTSKYIAILKHDRRHIPDLSHIGLSGTIKPAASWRCVGRLFPSPLKKLAKHTRAKFRMISPTSPYLASMHLGSTRFFDRSCASCVGRGRRTSRPRTHHAARNADCFERRANPDEHTQRAQYGRIWANLGI